MSELIHIGFSKGQNVDIRLLHTIVAAQTRYGKSTTIRAMMQHIPEDYKVLCMDVKDPRDFEGAGTEIPIFIEDKTDPLMLKQLLEQESHLWLRREFPELIDLCKEGDTFEKVYERVNKRMTEKVHPIVKDRLKVLQLLLKKLVENMAKVELSDTLELPSKNNVMNLSKSPSEIKQLAVYSVVKRVLEKHENVILVIDELPDFAPQQYKTPSKSMIGEAIRKGGAKGIWLWLSGQTMTGVDKQVLKQAMIWILGHQREINEAKRTLEQIPFKTGLDVKDIMTLPVGSFVVCTDEGAYVTYVQPEGVSDEFARKVSLGEVSVNEVVEMLKVKVMESDEVYMEKWEEEKKKREKLEQQLTELHEASRKDLEELHRQIETQGETIGKLNEKLEAFTKFQEVLVKPFAGYIEDAVSGRVKAEVEKALKSSIGVSGAAMTQALSLEHAEMIVNVKHSEKPVSLSTETQHGQIMYVAINELPKEGFTEREISEALKEHGWDIAHSSLAPALGSQLAKNGMLIKVPNTRPTRYRIPSKVQIKVEEV